ncbi:MAG TPA: arylsulfatase [Polyangiales bacterium]|nr:arylsulfatase [Polyangiales bacterium]
MWGCFAIVASGAAIAVIDHGMWAAERGSMTNRLWCALGMGLLLGGCATDSSEPAVDTDQEALASAKDTRPNILLLVADDLGYSDIGAFGGEIHTPNLDRLALAGRVLTDHHSAPTCSPTRASLISGTDHHLAGLGTMAELLLPEQQGKPGYEGYLNQRSLSIAELLKDGGYHTYVAGKWHLGLTQEKSAAAWGFESSFTLQQGASSHFAPDPARLTAADANAVFRENGVQTTVPSDFYSTDFYTDKLLSYFAAHEGDGKPFFAFAAYTSPHWPLQAPEAYLDRYRGRYDAGYEAIRQKRIAKQKLLGVIPLDARPSEPLPSTPDNPRWDELTPEQKRVEARRMEIYAAMVENLDHNIGRLIAYLERTGQLDNTFIFFQSDNGAEGGGSFPTTPTNDDSYENLGRRYSNVAYGKRWAEVGATPFRLWKAFSTEGGVVVPAIAHLPKQRLPRFSYHGLTHVSDLAPTFLELAGAKDPGTSYRGRAVNPITGKSILPRLESRAWEVHPAGTVLAEELFGRRYVRRDQWKLLFVEAPWGKGDWVLYDLENDRAESTDVSAQHPEIVSELRAEWDAYVARVGVVLPNTPGLNR